MNFKDQRGGGDAPEVNPATHAIATPARLVGCNTPALAPAWPPKVQAAIPTASPGDMLERPGQAEEDLRAEAAEIARTHRLQTGRWPTVMNWKGWERVGAARAAADGCTLIEGIRREGFLHPYASLPVPPRLGAPGAKPALQLTRQQLAERATTWTHFKGVGVVEAFKWLGLQS